MQVLSRMKISQKLPVLMAVMLIATGAALGITLTMKAIDGFTYDAEKNLTALATARKDRLQDYLTDIDADLMVQAKNPNTVKAIDDFTRAWGFLDASPRETLQKAYITDNPNPAGEKHKLTSSDTGLIYDVFHSTYHPFFRNLLEQKGYYDIFLTDRDGNVIYTTFKELDFATNLVSGKYAKTGLAKVFQQIQGNSGDAKLVFDDFKPYAPSADAPASFIGRGVYNRDNKLIGSLIFQMPVGRINGIMQSPDGMGETGETYVIGSDYLMRTDSRFSKDSTLLKTKIQSETVDAALSGQSGSAIITDYRGQEVVSAYTPLSYHGVKWAVIAEVDTDEALAEATAIRNISIALSIAITLVGIVLAVVFSRSLTRPISEITGAMGRLAKGDVDSEIPHADRSDEIGDMAAAVQVFKENAIARRRMEAEERDRVRLNDYRQRKLQEHIDGFRSMISELLTRIKSSVEHMHSASETLSANAEETQMQSATVSAATEQASANVQTVATASTELSASIEEISRQTSETTRILEEAVQQTNNASERMEGLAQSATQINEIVYLINDIADQTNLLALNATIEAARAGDAGKGFAVVASEVKNLANQTSRATEQIQTQIQHVQTETNAAVDVIKSISTVISRVNELSTAVAGAVEEQNASTAEISRNVEEASHGTQEVAMNIVEVNNAARETGEMSQNVYEAANELLSESDSLQVQIAEFLDGVYAIQENTEIKDD